MTTSKKLKSPGKWEGDIFVGGVCFVFFNQDISNGIGGMF